MDEIRKPRERIELIDTMRGLCVVLMCIHHFLLDLIELCGAPYWLFSNPVFDILHYIFAGMFIFLSGVSSRFSRSNVKRGLKCLAIAMAMTLVTALIDSIIVYGVLHLLGTCMLFYGLCSRALDKIPRKIQPVLYVALLVFTNRLVRNVSIGSAARFLFMFGWTYPGFHSADYFPLFPWMFVFLTGTWAGLYITERRLPRRFYTAGYAPLAKIGRMALLIYVLHQPVFYALIYAAKFIAGKM